MTFASCSDPPIGSKRILFVRWGLDCGRIGGRLHRRIFNMILTAFTLFHVAISLVAIFSGFVVVRGFLTAKQLDGWTAIFLAFTAGTSVTGFLFPFHRFMPSHVFGILSLLVLVPCFIARYRRHLAGHWRLVYVITAMIALWLNFFVLIAQMFQKVPALHALAPTGSEPPFLLTEVVVMVLFVALAVAAAIRFKTPHSLS